jgi:hypothetical protein
VADGYGWDALHVGGRTTYLEFLGGNKFRWTSSLSAGMNSASTHYPNTEGIAYHNSTLYFVSKVLKRMFILKLDDMTYTFENTGSKLMDKEVSMPSQIKSSFTIKESLFTLLKMVAVDLVFMREIVKASTIRCSGVFLVANILEMKLWALRSVQID